MQPPAVHGFRTSSPLQARGALGRSGGGNGVSTCITVMAPPNATLLAGGLRWRGVRCQRHKVLSKDLTEKQRNANRWVSVL